MASGVSHRAAKHGGSFCSSRTPSRGDGEPVLPAMSRSETCHSLVIRYQRTTELACGSNQQPIRRIAVFKIMQLVAAGCSLMVERHRFDAGAFEEAPDPCVNGDVEIYPP